MTKLYEVNKCDYCPHFIGMRGCILINFPNTRQVPIKIEQWTDEHGKHDHRHYPIPDWCPLPNKEA